MDSYSEKIMSTMRKQPDYNLMYSKAELLFPDTADFYNAVRYLHSHGILDYIENETGNHLGIHLTHYGVLKREIDRRDFRCKFFTQYLPGFISGIAVSVLSGLATAYLLQSLGI